MILLDTCVLFWIEADQSQLSAQAREAVADPSQIVFVSAISAFELGLKCAKNQLALPLPPHDWLMEIARRRGFRSIPIDITVAGRSTLLPDLHRDPCDRFLIASAMFHDLALVTPDALIQRYPDLTTVW